MSIILNLKQQERFWKKVDRRSDSECWEWQGYRELRRGGYGVACVGKRTAKAHRVAYTLVKGTIPHGLLVMHTVCDNPPCCNPSHLKLGTNAENIRERHIKDRDNHPIGQRNGRAKITFEQAQKIREEKRAGVSVSDLCKKYQLGKSMVGYIVQGKFWKQP